MRKRQTQLLTEIRGSEPPPITDTKSGQTGTQILNLDYGKCDLAAATQTRANTALWRLSCGVTKILAQDLELSLGGVSPPELD